MKKYIIGIIITLILGIGIYFTSKIDFTETKSNSQIKILSNNTDIGEIPMDEGKVRIPFEFINTGTGDILLGDAQTSCMCTDGIVTSLDGKYQSNIIQMPGHGAIINLKKILKPNEKLLLVAIFDPNAHGPDAIGPISRDVYIKTNSLLTPELDFKFMGNVVKTRTKTKQTSSKTSTSNELFSFDVDSFDFGIIKQSAGKVSHDFKFTYNGDKPIKVTGTPTSCACTSATIDKTEFNKGDIGVLNVTFNPNLHEEPEGKFFKTVNILTDEKLDKIPEVKIWVQIDLDLGKDAFELKGQNHDD